RTLPCPRGRARSGQSATRGRPARPWAAVLPDGRSTQRRAPATYRREDAVPPGAETLPGTGGQVMLKLHSRGQWNSESPESAFMIGALLDLFFLPLEAIMSDLLPSDTRARNRRGVCRNEVSTIERHLTSSHVAAGAIWHR